MITIREQEITPSFDVVLPTNINTPAAVLHYFNREVESHFPDTQFDNASYTCMAILANGERFFLSIGLNKKRI